MNISHEHKTIWWAPERTGTKITRKIFSNYGFLVYDPKIGDEVTIKTRYTSHLNEIPEKYTDYRLISSVRNPYDRVFSIFLLTRYSDIAIEKGTYNEIRNNFNNWLLDAFKGEKTSVRLEENYSSEDINYNFFSKWTFSEKKPDFFIKMETLQEDLENLDFIQSDPNWNSSKISEILGNNIYKTNKPIRFDKMYDFYGAKLIYFYFKSVFNLIPYNPFSFTTENLSESEKVSFLHDIL